MITISIVITIFILLSMSSILGILVFVVDTKWIPKIIIDLYSYGKSCEGKVFGSSIRTILIPKSWFTHFYVFGVFYTFLVLITMMWKIVLKNQLSTLVTSYISFVSPYTHNPLASPELSLLAAVLFFLQTSRRLYECLCVTVFADSKMNLGHYLVGYLHYWGCATVILSYSADYSSTNDFVWIPSSNDIPLQPIFGIILFTLAYCHQYIAHVSLANLRKDPKNKQKHSLPKNGLFNYVSCPNFLCEIIIYVSLYIILGFNHYPWALVTFWVLTNQIMTATMTHNWYKSKFKEFPKTRKAIIPFIY
ncbi:polyprenol reductase-like [Daphnia pulicaria]|uniref:polyprenol reductase-like n=1 Tax=Daphnia pulicaria TaxID=35523 RepID=UPI001EEC9CF8|nr:polyprenol reductase-like [Daphnia pulicaria]